MSEQTSLVCDHCEKRVPYNEAYHWIEITYLPGNLRYPFSGPVASPAHFCTVTHLVEFYTKGTGRVYAPKPEGAGVGSPALRPAQLLSQDD